MKSTSANFPLRNLLLRCSARETLTGIDTDAVKYGESSDLQTKSNTLFEQPKEFHRMHDQTIGNLF
jgi:hypothetical protein